MADVNLRCPCGVNVIAADLRSKQAHNVISTWIEQHRACGQRKEEQ